MTPDTTSALARQAIEGLLAAGDSVATAESLTGGLVCAALTSIPGASAVVRGGVVSYAIDVKADVLGVDAGLLARDGAVDPAVALAMARGVRKLLGAAYGVATTGAAGPDPEPGGERTGPVPPGRGFVAVAGPDGEAVTGFACGGDREEVRAKAVATALDLLVRSVRNRVGDGRTSAGEGSVAP